MTARPAPHDIRDVRIFDVLSWKYANFWLGVIIELGGVPWMVDPALN